MSEGSAKRHSDLNLGSNQNNDLDRSSYETGSRLAAAAHDPGQKTVTSKSNSMAAAKKKDSDNSQLTGKVVTKKKKSKAGGNAASGGNNSAHNNNNRESNSQSKNNSGKTKKLTMAQINGAESEISGTRRDDAPIGSAAISKKIKSTSSASMRNNSK